MAITEYNLQYREVGQAITTVAGIATTTYALTGLAGGTNYQTRYQFVDVTNGVTQYSAYSAWSDFSTTAAVEPIVVVLGLIAGGTRTVTPMGAELTEPPTVVEATSWEIKVIKLSDLSSVTYYPVTQKSFMATGLLEGEAYKAEIRGESGGEYSDAIDIEFTAGVKSTIQATQSAEQALDAFYSTFDFDYSLAESWIDFSGVPTEDAVTVKVWLDGSEVDATNEITSWFASYYEGVFGAFLMDELDGRHYVEFGEGNLLGF